MIDHRNSGANISMPKNDDRYFNHRSLVRSAPFEVCMREISIQDGTEPNTAVVAVLCAKITFAP